MLNSSLPVELAPTLEDGGFWAGEQIFGGPKIPAGSGAESGELKELGRKPPWPLAALWFQGPQIQGPPTSESLEFHLWLLGSKGPQSEESGIDTTNASSLHSSPGF